ncbi:MAG: hypothetical protein QNL87_02240 [Gammaproteobacteria bacterium]|nr:hypothetical protein [Gammaproteobacteria bacterium]
MRHWLNNRIAVYWGVAICSGLLTLYRISTRDLINGDGIVYIDIARAFLSEGISAAIAVYHWPFYGILIGVVHKLTGLSFENSAIGLNTLFLIVVCVVFVRVYEEISGREARIWVAAILVLALPILNEYREMVIRGYGFWACMLAALYYFIQYSRSPGLQSALKWQLSIAVATLFRVEGVAFLVFAPFCLLFMAEARGRIVTHLFRLNGLFLLLAAAGVLVMLVSGELTTRMEIPNQLDYTSPLALLGALNTEAGMMYGRNRFMGSVDEARLILAAGLLTLVLVKVLSNTGLAFLAVWGYGVHRKWIRLTRESYIVLYFAAIGFLTLVPVAGNYFFISTRYTILTVLLISLIMFQYVDYLFRELSARQLHKWSLAAGVFILILFLDGVISGPGSKRNIRVAGEWLASGIAAEERIACNEARLEFYAEDRCKWIPLGKLKLTLTEYINELKKQGYTYLLFWIDREDAPLRLAVEADSSLVLEKEFPNNKGDSVRLYRVVAEEY